MTPLLGNERANAVLASAFAGRPFHAYLVCGPEGSGRMTFAQNLAAGLVCTSKEKKPCGRCLPCKKAQAHAHPDIITLQKTGKRDFKIDQARDQVSGDIYIMPNEAEYKIYILPDMEYANDKAQNALLKVLEEPPAYGVMVLLVKSAEDVLPTVRSRCLRVDMQPLPADMLRGLLKKEFPKESEGRIEEAARESGGYLGAARELLAGTAEEVEKKMAAALAACDELEIFMAFAQADALAYDERRRAFARFCGILSEALRVKSGGDASREARALASRFSEAKLAALLEKALSAYHKSERSLPFGVTGTAAAAGLYEIAASKNQEEIDD